MSLTVNFKEARLSAMTLAKVGNPLRDEPVQCSKTLCRFDETEAELLTHCFLKSFRSLDLHQLDHHSDLMSNEMYRYASAIFEDNGALLDAGEQIARHLHAKSNHPAIKAGDLCIALINGLIVDGEEVQAISIIKSESKVPFLQISVRDGDLRLTTEQGIYPDKIDKGCLIVNHNESEGYAVYFFDKSGGDTHFWKRDFIGATAVRSDDYLTKRYSELCVAFAEKGLPEETGQEARVEVAKRAIDYLEEADDFDLEEFQEATLKEPEQREQFSAFKAQFEEESGQELEDKFPVSKKEAKKAKKRLKSRLKLDVGVDLKFSSGFIDQSDKLMERGFDDDKHMHYVKVYYHREG